MYITILQEFLKEPIIKKNPFDNGRTIKKSVDSNDIITIFKFT